MSREVFAVSVTVEEGKYAIEYAGRLGIPKTVFVQNLVKEALAELKKYPLPEQREIIEEPVYPVEKYVHPKNTTFWRRYKEEIK